MKVCSKWVYLEVSWVDFECFYALFMKVCMTFEQFFGYFWPWPFLGAIFDPIWAIQGHFWTILGQNRVILGWFWTVLVAPGSLWDHFGIALTPFWGLFWPYCGPFSPFWGHFHSHVAVSWWCFGKSTATLSKMTQGRAKTWKFLPKFTKFMQKCSRTCPFSPIKHLFCLETIKIAVSTYESVQQMGVSGRILSEFWVFLMLVGSKIQ